MQQEQKCSIAARDYIFLREYLKGYLIAYQITMWEEIYFIRTYGNMTRYVPIYIII